MAINPATLRKGDKIQCDNWTWTLLNKPVGNTGGGWWFQASSPLGTVGQFRTLPTDNTVMISSPQSEHLIVEVSNV